MNMLTLRAERLSAKVWRLQQLVKKSKRLERKIATEINDIAIALSELTMQLYDNEKAGKDGDCID